MPHNTKAPNTNQDMQHIFGRSYKMAVVRTFNVELKVNGDGAYAFVAEPDDNAKHPGVVLIQEWWGMDPHIRDLAQKLAIEDFEYAVPDLYHVKVSTEPNYAQKRVMIMRGK